MKTTANRTTTTTAMLAAAMLAACGGQIEAGGEDVDAGAATDPLAFDDDYAPGSFDEIHRTIIAERCSGQPGLCHNGQFEPNLSTPALAYAYLVNRPAIENDRVLRVASGDPDASFLIDKLRGRDVGTIMPLGADPLSEDEIQLVEDWIAGGALRTPQAPPAPTLNNPPKPPEIGVFDGAGNRLDTFGPASIAPGTTLVIRHSVSDFEVDDSQIPFALAALLLPDGRAVVLNPAAPSDKQLGPTSFDPGGPMGNGDLLNYRLDVTIGATIPVTANGIDVQDVPSAGLVLTPVAAYLDSLEPDGIATLTVSTNPITVE